MTDEQIKQRITQILQILHDPKSGSKACLTMLLKNIWQNYAKKSTATRNQKDM